jgi:hypothetical protein
MMCGKALALALRRQPRASCKLEAPRGVSLHRAPLLHPRLSLPSANRRSKMARCTARAPLSTRTGKSTRAAGACVGRPGVASPRTAAPDAGPSPPLTPAPHRPPRRRVYGKRHGIGTYTYLDGGSYSGEWVDDRIQGEGTCIFANKNTYTGSWEDGRISGFGTLTYADGDKVRGGRGRMSAEGRCDPRRWDLARRERRTHTRNWATTRRIALHQCASGCPSARSVRRG